MPKRTKRSVERFPVRTDGYFEWDSAVRRFGVRIMTSGTRTYEVQDRKGDRTRQAPIGQHSTITVEQARTRWRRSRSAVARPPVAVLCERFYQLHALERCKQTTRR